MLTVPDFTLTDVAWFSALFLIYAGGGVLVFVAYVGGKRSEK